MSNLISSKARNESSVKNAMEKPRNLKINYPNGRSSEDALAGIRQQFRNVGEKNLGVGRVVQSGLSNPKLKFQCHYEERKRRADTRRKNAIQKLKNVYNIDVNDLNENVIDEIVRKIRLAENEKRERKKRNTERKITIITRLLKEQKYKMRESNAPCFPPKRLTIPKINEEVCTESTKSEPECMKVVWENQIQQNQDADNSTLSNEEGEEEEEEEEGEKEKKGMEPEPLACFEMIKSKKEKNEPKISLRKPPPCVSFEKCLECTPRRIVFKDYKKQKVYFQDLRITNVGIETIHCRYLGILVHSQSEGKFPIGVAVRDSVKLRPGLSCSTKIRLCSPEDSNEMECSIVYETRRKNKFLEYSWFFVPVACTPARAIVKVTPMRIAFPAFTWCAATGSENANYLKKILKIENSGGKACTCRISDEKTRNPDRIYGEEEVEEESLNLSGKSESEFSESTTDSFRRREEFFGEYYRLSPEVSETAKSLVNELIENVFATFRFSTKYCIEIPPLSVEQIEVRFIPKYKGFHHETKRIRFEGCHNVEELNIELMGDVKQIPLKVEPQLIDLKTCVIDSGVYAGKFQVFNSSRGPYAIKLKIPPSLKNHAHVHPRTTIIQPFSSCVFSARIYPRFTLSKDAPRYFDEDSGVLEFPVRIHPANTDSCKLDHVKLYVHALLTTCHLELSPRAVDFGTVTTLETVRTKLELTNHSLVIQEFGFLNLPRGTRVEPNMGFGRILPKETITLYLMYSPVPDFFQKGWGEEQTEFDVMVNSIADYGGFKEKPEPEEVPETEWKGEGDSFDHSDFIRAFSAESEEVQSLGESEGSDLCDEDFSVEGEELTSKIRLEENKIREFLKREDDETSRKSFLNQGNLRNEEEREKNGEHNRGTFPAARESERGEKSNGTFWPGMNVIKCRANVLGPRCQMSETVIQLPATPTTSFSLYRFRLNGVDALPDASCTCGRKKTSESWGGNPKFTAAFEFLHSSPQIKLEPGSGFLKAGDVSIFITSLPITIISRPEIGSGESRNEPASKKASDASRSRLIKKESLISRSNTGLKQSNQKKNYEATSRGTRKFDETSTGGVIEAADSSLMKLKAAEDQQSLQEMIDSFSFETKVRCVIKTLPGENQNQVTEVHDMVLICPTIRRHFTYLGKCQEINFGKVFIGTQSRITLQVQNVSLERISPSMTLLNPAGPFSCPGSFCKVEIDPEHIWRQPLTFVPEERAEVDQFFEIYFGPTNALLKVVGEAVEPRCNILPTFGCCLLEARSSSFEEIKMEIHNPSPVELFLQLKTAFVREGFDLQIEENETEGITETKVKADRKEDPKGKKSKNTESERRKHRLWETPPEMVLKNLENFTNSSNGSVFTVLGGDQDNNFVVLPNEASQIKIQFWAPADGGDKKYAAKYNLMLQRRILLKEIIILGRIFK